MKSVYVVFSKKINDIVCLVITGQDSNALTISILNKYRNDFTLQTVAPPPKEGVATLSNREYLSILSSKTLGGHVLWFKKDLCNFMLEVGIGKSELNVQDLTETDDLIVYDSFTDENCYERYEEIITQAREYVLHKTTV